MRGRLVERVTAAAVLEDGSARPTTDVERIKLWNS